MDNSTKVKGDMFYVERVEEMDEAVLKTAEPGVYIHKANPDLKEVAYDATWGRRLMAWGYKFMFNMKIEDALRKETALETEHKTNRFAGKYTSLSKLLIAREMELMKAGKTDAQIDKDDNMLALRARLKQVSDEQWKLQES